MQNPADIDVLVVGAGPTGLMLANQLARHDVRLRIVDRNHGPSIRTKALGVQARTLEIYDRLGIAERAIELGTRATGANLWCKGRPAARVSLGDGRDLTPYPFLLILGQDDNERLLGDALHDRGMDVTWDTELVGLTQGPGHAVATLRRGDGSLSEVRANWVAGCDGAHSAVRRLCGIAFAGSPYEQVFFIADTRATGTMVPGELNAYLRRDGFHLFFPMRGKDRWRVVGIVPPDLRAREDLDFDAVLPSIRKEAGPHLSLPECHWFSTYRIHHRRAERFRDRRCFLLGDAAHIHSPVGAQGMNTGLQDAYNLAWKLALVASGLARDTLLDSYESERIPVAERLLRTTDQAFSLFVSDRWGAGLLRARFLPGVLALAMKRERIRKRAFRTISQIGIRYAGGPLSDPRTDLPDGAPRAGDRFPWLRLKLAPDSPAEDLFARLDDTRFQLILFGQPFVPGNSSDHEGMVRIHRVPDDPVNDQECARARIPRPSFYLLRPDGHVGVAGKIVESATLARYLVERIQYRAEWDRPLPRRRAA